MSAVAWTHWDEAFLAAEKFVGGRATYVLKPALYERALVSLASEHGWLPKSDPRYQEACRTGRLEWWDGRGRCVVVVREGARDSAGEWARGMTPAQARAADVREGLIPTDGPDATGRAMPKVGDAGPPLDGKPTVITSIEEVKPGLTAATYETKPGKGKKK